jgi:tyrosinase
MTDPDKSPDTPYSVQIHGSSHTINFHSSTPSVFAAAPPQSAPVRFASINITPLSTPGTRKSIQTLIKQHKAGQPKELEDLVQAFYLLQQKAPSDPYSFFTIGSMHGQPFKLRPAVDDLSNDDFYQYWGGFCHHGNVLFPVWHRAYMQHLENALQSVVPSAHMAYWDQLDGKDLPQIFLDENFTFADGRTIKNPLRSYTLQQEVHDMPSEQSRQDKPVGYETKRFPYSGLVGTHDDQEETKRHNAQFTVQEGNRLLVQSLRHWLDGDARPGQLPNGTAAKWETCLKAPNYTVFSNTTSAAAYNAAIRINQSQEVVVSLESPHNDIHVAIGTFDRVDQSIQGAHGDMGEPNTAGFDPIFYFHHCFVDYMFWEWQTLHNSTERIEIVKRFPGTATFDSQGPTPGYNPRDELKVSSPLYPYIKKNGGDWLAGEMANVRSLGFNYEPRQKTLLKREARNLKVASFDHSPFKQDLVMIQSWNRTVVKGSAVLMAWAKSKVDPEKKYFLGYHTVFQRWNTERCANCQTHLELTTVFQPRCIPATDTEEFEYYVEVLTHKGVIREHDPEVTVF